MLSAYSEKVLLESMPQFTGYIESLELRGKFVRTKSEHAWYRAVSFYAATSNVTSSMRALQMSMPIAPKVLDPYLTSRSFGGFPLRATLRLNFGNAIPIFVQVFKTHLGV
jgi:hypothetical protein